VANLRASVALRAPFVPRFLKKRENKLRNSNLWSEKWGVLLNAINKEIKDKRKELKKPSP
jgi:hypothetical protein